MSRHHARIPSAVWARLRRTVLVRDGYRCQACGRAGRLEVDHIVPLANGGAATDLENLQALCGRPCHRDKTLAETRRPLGPRALAWARLVDELT